MPGAGCILGFAKHFPVEKCNLVRQFQVPNFSTPRLPVRWSPVVFRSCVFRVHWCRPLLLLRQNVKASRRMLDNMRMLGRYLGRRCSLRRPSPIFIYSYVLCPRSRAEYTTQLECFQLGKADLHSLDFTFNRLCMKLFKTGSIAVVKDCQNYFAIDLPSSVLKKEAW